MMPARAEFTVRLRHLDRYFVMDSRLRGNDDLRLGYNDTGYPTLRMDSWWSFLKVCCDSWIPSQAVDDEKGKCLVKSVIPVQTGIHVAIKTPSRKKGSHKCVGEKMGYWSASPYAANATNAWNVNFNNGNDNVNNKTNNNGVRLVRGGEWIT